MMRSTLFLLTLLSLCLAVSPVAAQTKPAKKPVAAARPAVANATRGQKQLAGINGQFGTTYTLESGFNYTILSAHYTLDPLLAYEPVTAGRDEKIVALKVAIKNSNPEDNFFNSENHGITLVDSENQLYTSNNYVQLSQPGKTLGTLRPGQGWGQGTDTLLVGVKVPAKARIVKIMLNQARKGTSEKVIRFYVAGATKAEAGEAGDPLNVIAPLPEEIRAAGDTSGAVLASPAPAKFGVFVPSGTFSLRVDGITYSTSETYENNAPEEGKQYAIISLTARYLGLAETGIYYALAPSEVLSLTDANGDSATFFGTRKAQRDEGADKTFKTGDEYKFRVFYVLPKDVKATKFILGSESGFLYQYDLTAK